MTGRSGE